MKLNNLNKDEKHVILEKGTEKPFSGEYDKFDQEGIYTCRQCGAYLYRSNDKFDSGCGWPSFDDEIDGAVNKTTDADGTRTEITCNRCDGHLGHVFEGEGLTNKNTRHCVNSVSMKFIEKGEVENIETIYLGGGCFWCIEAVFKMIDGVIEVVSGYAGGEKDNPDYQEVSSGETGHAEVVKVSFDRTIVSLEKVLDVFFDSHDPTTLNKQGNDIGTQYRSAIYCENEKQLDVAENYISKKQKEFKDPIITQTAVLEKIGTGKFYKAEDYHQEYFKNNSQQPYCQLVVAPKVEKIEKKYKNN
jgi:peptide methionine sulfoxide reductase msrA/msrB